MKNILFIILAVMVLPMTQVCAQTKVIAHRGYWDCEGSAQNSIVALYKAHEVKAYGSEFDILITADGIPVINHDDIIQDFVIEETNYETIRDLKLKNGEIMPTLEQYLVHGKACKETKLILEIKPHKTKENDIRAVNAVLALVEKMELQAQVEYISFSMNVCKKIIRLRPEALVAYLKGDIDPRQLKDMGFAGLDYHYSEFTKHPDWIKESKQLGLTVNVWTVNDAELMKSLITQGVDYITTDKPSLLQEILNDKK